MTETSLKERRRQAKYRAKNKAKDKARKAAWYRANKERIAQRQKAYRVALLLAQGKVPGVRRGAPKKEIGAPVKKRQRRIWHVLNDSIAAKHQARRERDSAISAVQYATRRLTPP